MEDKVFKIEKVIHRVNNCSSQLPPPKGRGFRGLNIIKVTWKGIDNSMLQMS